jgi:hypothetical protein
VPTYERDDVSYLDDPTGGILPTELSDNAVEVPGLDYGHSSPGDPTLGSDDTPAPDDDPDPEQPHR